MVLLWREKSPVPGPINPRLQVMRRCRVLCEEMMRAGNAVLLALPCCRLPRDVAMFNPAEQVLQAMLSG